MSELKDYAEMLAKGAGDTRPIRVLNEQTFKMEREGTFPDPKIWEPFVYIVALERRHAELLAEVNQIPRNYWRHVSRRQDLHGAIGNVCFYYRWYELPERDEIQDYANALADRLKIIELSDDPVTS